jgi:hypothetical protein
MKRAIAFAALSCACGSLEQAPAPPYRVELAVESDPGVALAGAQILHNASAVATTGPKGVALLTLRGAEGDSYDFQVKCPVEFTSPSKPITVFLRRIDERDKLPRYQASCPPSTRTTLVAVRAENGAYLPVLYLGQPVATTDASGAALVSLKLKPGEQFELTLSTVGKDAETLRPQNPSATFIAKAKDDVAVFDQRFTIEKKAVFGPVVDRRPKKL